MVPALSPIILLDIDGVLNPVVRPGGAGDRAGLCQPSDKGNFCFRQPQPCPVPGATRSDHRVEHAIDVEEDNRPQGRHHGL